jgi:ubiquinone/menaquinone biosynthesis C-methylase UbiE
MPLRADMLIPMATPWDRAAVGYLDEWVPRFVPYHLDLVRELRIAAGQSVLVTSAGPGSEVLAVARAVGDTGRVRATDKSAEMVRVCTEQVAKGGFGANVACEAADASDVRGAGAGTGKPRWDAILNAFGLWQLPDRRAVLEAWSGALAPNGKVGILTWGPPDKDDPFELLAQCLKALEPDYAVPETRILAAREAMEAMFAEAGLTMVRHTVVRHTLSFKSGEAFVKALREACTWRRIWEEIGDARIGRLASRFYDMTGGPDAPLSFDPPATLAIAALPGAEVELEHRPSLRVPAASTHPPKL